MPALLCGPRLAECTVYKFARRRLNVERASSLLRAIQTLTSATLSQGDSLKEGSFKWKFRRLQPFEQARGLLYFAAVANSCGAPRNQGLERERQCFSLERYL